MAKDPAVLFYTSDFLSGTFTMTNEQVGKYIRLLCLQHQKGKLTEKDMLSICSAYDDEIYCKFEKIGDEYVNIRLKNESERRKKFSESRRSNAQSTKKQTVKNKKSGKAYAKHMETETETETVTITGTKTETENPFGKNFQYWDGWKRYKLEEHREKYKSPKTEMAAMDHLFKLAHGDPETARQIIEQSIANRWKGLFELKNHGSTKNKQGATKEGLIAKLDERFAKQRQGSGDGYHEAV